MTMPADALTDREIEILRLIAEGLSNQDIAQALILAPETVKWYNKHIFSKLHVHNRTQAAARAKALGLLNRDSSASSSPLPIKSFPYSDDLVCWATREIAAIKEALDRTRLLTLTGLRGPARPAWRCR
ncbi:MAG: response regulator transcription factor [Chloroflexi bacterium]|nr:response regulator transcription factor [Chloroflexota bacterium]